MCTFVSAKTDSQEKRKNDRSSYHRPDIGCGTDYGCRFRFCHPAQARCQLCWFCARSTVTKLLPFYVSPAKGLCKCFACGQGGNAVHFIMAHEQMSYPEALRYLAKKYNIEIKERELSDEEKLVQSERESLFIVNNFARDYFQNILKNHVDGRSIGMAYFRNRGFRDDIIEKFQLGYCTESHDALAKEALQKGYKKEYLVKTGLCYETDDHRLRDRFWGRVIFPVHTLSGKVVAFGGRVLASATKGVKVKYVNSPESEIYHKK